VSFASLLAQVDDAATQHLGGVVTYATGAGASVAVEGIFDAAYVLVDANEAGVSSSGPAVFLRVADLPSDPTVDSPTVTVASVVYEVREAKPDGLGGVLLLLHKVA
jgi:hypothetical protein